MNSCSCWNMWAGNERVACFLSTHRGRERRKETSADDYTTNCLTVMGTRFSAALEVCEVVWACQVCDSRWVQQCWQAWNGQYLLSSPSIFFFFSFFTPGNCLHGDLGQPEQIWLVMQLLLDMCVCEHVCEHICEAASLNVCAALPQWRLYHSPWERERCCFRCF